MKNQTPPITTDKMNYIALIGRYYILNTKFCLVGGCFIISFHALSIFFWLIHNYWIAVAIENCQCN